MGKSIVKFNPFKTRNADDWLQSKINRNKMSNLWKIICETRYSGMILFRLIDFKVK